MNRRALALALLSIGFGCGGEAFSGLLTAPESVDSGADVSSDSEPGDAGPNPVRDGPISFEAQGDERTPVAPFDGAAGGSLGGFGGTGGAPAGGSGGQAGTGGTDGADGTGGAPEGGSGGQAGNLPAGSLCSSDSECAGGFCDAQPGGANACVDAWATGRAYAQCTTCADPSVASCGCGSLAVDGGRLWRCRMLCGQVEPGIEQGSWMFVRGPLLPPGAWCAAAAQCASGTCDEPEGAQHVCK